MITKSTIVEAHFKDVTNKIYNEKFTMKIYFLGIRIWQRKMDRQEHLPEETKKMGFK